MNLAILFRRNQTRPKEKRYFGPDNSQDTIDFLSRMEYVPDNMQVPCTAPSNMKTLAGDNTKGEIPSRPDKWVLCRPTYRKPGNTL